MPATDAYWRNLRSMHGVFAISAIVLLLATVLMAWDDQSREWRDYQKQAEDLRVKKIKSQMVVYQSGEFQQEVAALDEKIETAEQRLESRSDEFQRLQAELNELIGEVTLLERKVKFQNAERDVASANRDLGVRDDLPKDELDVLLDKFQTAKNLANQYALQLEELKAKQSAKQSQLAELTDERDELATQKKKLLADKVLMEASLASLSPEEGSFSSFKRWLMEQPIIDGFNSPLEIKQEWIQDLPVTLGMATVARFDRCRTCHVMINETGSGNVPTFPAGDGTDGTYEQPYSTHPNPNVYLTASSPHPIDVYGCTICHDGDGSGTSFQNAEHTPNNPAEAHAWKDEHHWHSNHFWEYPMQPDRFIESTCIKCHHSVTELGINKEFGATAPKVVEGFNLISQYGCFGCHEINGYDSGRPIGPDLRLEPNTPEDAAKIAADPGLVAGQMRKVGPSLRHIALKTTREFISYWTEEPKRFRPGTRMPQFFDLTNQHDELAGQLQPVELAGIAAYLMSVSQPLELHQPQEGYEPNAERGKTAFTVRGCLTCHSHDGEQFKGIDADFGPDLSKVHEKIKPGEEGFRWLYTWLRQPNLYHTRTKMPDLYLDPEGEGDNYSDPAADIAAFLLEGGPREFPAPQFDEEALDALVALHVRGKALPTADYKRMIATRSFPKPSEQIKGDEIELARREDDPEPLSDEQWRERQLIYVGRKTVSRYGCYGCHDIPGFEEARPIGVALQDWGRKDTSKLAFEHITEWLHHHGEPDGDSTYERVEDAMKSAINNDAATPEGMSASFFYESIEDHGRPGFIWQKLRQPRSYDYEKIKTKGYDERLKMPRFPFDEQQIEAIATFVLGLVAEPPPTEFIYSPGGDMAAKIEGERVLQKYNCAGCHILELPKIEYGADLDDMPVAGLPDGNFEDAYNLLLKLKPPRDALTGQQLPTGEPVISFHGLPYFEPDPDDDFEDQEWAFDSWETLQINDDIFVPGNRLIVPAASIVSKTDGRGGPFAKWLVEYLKEERTDGNPYLAWQMVPPPLYLEGIKVQTPWLYRFLKNPDKIRHTPVLRMPRFNMDDDEARALADYFAAVDDTQYPYQMIEQREPMYLQPRSQAYRRTFEEGDSTYLHTGWNVLNANLCIKCHAVGGSPYVSQNPAKDIRGPNLENVEVRLRPEWLALWIYNPKWFIPYTSMPQNFQKGKEVLPELYGGQGDWQTIGVRDALMNYDDLMEIHGKTVYKPKGGTPAEGDAPADAPAAADADKQAAVTEESAVKEEDAKVETEEVQTGEKQ